MLLFYHSTIFFRFSFSFIRIAFEFVFYEYSETLHELLMHFFFHCRFLCFTGSNRFLKKDHVCFDIRSFQCFFVSSFLLPVSTIFKNDNTFWKRPHKTSFCFQILGGVQVDDVHASFRLVSFFFCFFYFFRILALEFLENFNRQISSDINNE